MIRYFKRNWYVVVLLVSSVLWGINGGNANPWKDWETASILVTVIYAGIIYFKLFFDEGIPRKKLLLAVPALILICSASTISRVEQLEINGIHLLTGSRVKAMGVLFLG